MKAMIFGVFDCFTNSPTNYCLLKLASSLAAKTLGRKLKQLLEFLIVTFCFHLLNVTCDVYTLQFKAVKQCTRTNNYFASCPQFLNKTIVFGFTLVPT